MSLAEDQDEINEVLFEGRNKEYGAYELRRDYRVNILKALRWAIISFLFFSFLLLFRSGCSNNYGNEELRNQEIVLYQPPPLEKKHKEKIPPPSSMQQPKKSPPPPKPTPKILPPKVKDAAIEPPPNIGPPAVTPPIDTSNQTANGSNNPSGTTGGTTPPPPPPPPPPPDPNSKPPPEQYLEVESIPEFQGGDQEMYRWLLGEIKYPNIARENQIGGTVMVECIVEKTGKITNVKVIQGLPNGGAGCDAEALRVIRAMPDWKPGIFKGKPIRVFIYIPVRFKLQ
jgi:periplasmic protein TonB